MSAYRHIAAVCLFLFAGTIISASAQEPKQEPQPQDAAQNSQTTRLTVQSQLVFVPTAVQTGKGAPIYGLTADDFVIEDNGIRQRPRLDESGTVQPLSIVVAVQCSREAWAEAQKMRGLSTMVDAIIGGAPAEVAVIQFGTGEDLLSKFETDPNRRTAALNQLAPCEDGGNTIYDAVEYAGQVLEAHKAKGRRVVLLVSETRDHGSEVKAEHVVEQLARSNIVVDALTFSPFRDEQVGALKYERQSSLLNPAALIYTIIQSLRTNAPKTLARMSGGEYMNFATGKGFDRELLTLANHVNNYYVLSFVPHFPADTEGSMMAQPGLHDLRVTVTKYPDAKIRHRESYWAEGIKETPPPAEPPKP
ncbi:MAG TPA: VWA domain-containing protein [Acidobacteriaceae bacterium]